MKKRSLYGSIVLAALVLAGFGGAAFADQAQQAAPPAQGPVTGPRGPMPAGPYGGNTNGAPNGANGNDYVGYCLNMMQAMASDPNVRGWMNGWMGGGPSRQNQPPTTTPKPPSQ